MCTCILCLHVQAEKNGIMCDPQNSVSKERCRNMHARHVRAYIRAMHMNVHLVEEMNERIKSVVNEKDFNAVFKAYKSRKVLN